MTGEFDLIARLRSLAEAEGAAGSSAADGRIALASGDDASVTVPRGATATSVDALVEGVHFDLTTAPPRSVGAKALASALSDLAAMGAEPGEAYVIVGVPEGLPEEDLLDVGAGLVAVASAHGVAIVGGDVTRAPVLWLGLTVVGHRDAADELVGRGGATPGEVLAVTGALGGAAGGLRLLEDPELRGAIDPEPAAELVRRQLEPEPRIAAGLRLAAAGASAMIDVSDGLGADASHLADASGVRVEIELEAIPVDPALDALTEAAGVESLELAAGGGEDYELLAAIPEDRFAAARAAVAEAGTTLTEIGRTLRGAGTVLRGRDGTELAPTGFDQLGRSRARSGRA
jgi:thiamine-monophosphate kinase